MSDLDEKEQNHVRSALRYLRRRLGAWAVVSEALHVGQKSIEMVAGARRSVTASLAFRVARLAEVSVDDLLAGRFLPAGACPKCGHVPDFADENTAVESAPRPGLASGIKLVK